jgi:hypothetical protein
MRALITAVAAVALLVPSVAFAEVVDRGPNGFTLKTGVEITMTYAVGGYAPGGLETLAELVDAVMAHQVGLLKQHMERLGL